MLPSDTALVGKPLQSFAEQLRDNLFCGELTVHYANSWQRPVQSVHFK